MIFLSLLPSRWRRATTGAIARRKWDEIAKPWVEAWVYVSPWLLAGWEWWLESKWVENFAECLKWIVGNQG